MFSELIGNRGSFSQATGNHAFVFHTHRQSRVFFSGYAGNAQTVRIQSVSESKTSDFLGEWGTIVPTGMNASEWYQVRTLVAPFAAVVTAFPCDTRCTF